ncbi:MAG: hypothetical protein JOY58_14330 [Solirubrobacterales bacterium]|nr:hypothetical protein [Solirubrobacterales bacterium]MBV9049449.1 hypothetical protein [Solirubrobacterales bacterium]
MVTLLADPPLAFAGVLALAPDEFELPESAVTPLPPAESAPDPELAELALEAELCESVLEVPVLALLCAASAGS